MTELDLNPRLSIRRLLVDGQPIAYALIAPVKGRGLLKNTVELASASADVLEVLEALARADADVEVGEDACSTLVDLGVLVHGHEVSGPVRFSCRLGGDGPAHPASLVVNPDVAITGFVDLVTPQRDLQRALEPCAELVLVTDPVHGARHPYWLDEHERALLVRLIEGALAPTDLADADARRFAGAGILVDEQAIAAARDRLGAAVARFARHGYAVLPRLLPPLQVAALRSYYRDLVAEGYVAPRDTQVPLRSAQHNEPLMQYYHHQLLDLFRTVTDQPIKPSYGYFISYRRGAALDKHRDREQCKFSASLLIDYEAAASDDASWPLYLELPATGEQVAVELMPGDCVLFSGGVQPHYRHALRAERSTSLLLHYVDEAFSGSLR
jgi:alkylated DNA repair dioxygenase AlkB